MSDRQRILCVGMCVLDIIHICEKYPSEDTDKRSLTGHWQRGGNASNVCTVLRQLGAECEFLGMLSTAAAFKFLQQDCTDRNIHIENCPMCEETPPFSTVILAANTGSRTIIHSNPGFPILKFQHFQNLKLSNYKWIHFEGRNVTETSQMIWEIRKYRKQAKDRGEEFITVSVELERQDMDLLALARIADIVILSKDMSEFLGWSTHYEAAYGMRQLLLDLQDRAKETDKKIETIPSIVCPWGSEGCAYLGGDSSYGSFLAVPATAVVDSLGAGDTFAAGFIFAQCILNMDIRMSVDYANQVAGFKILYRGYDMIKKFQYRKT